MIRNLQVLAIALLVSSVSLAFGQAKEVDDTKVGGKSVVGDDGTKKAPSAATAKMKPGKEKKVYVGKSHEEGKSPAAQMDKEKHVAVSLADSSEVRKILPMKTIQERKKNNFSFQLTN